MAKNFFDESEEPLTPQPLNPRAKAFGKKNGNNNKKVIIISLSLVVCVIVAIFFFFKVIRSPKEYSDNKNISQNKTDAVITNTYVDVDQLSIVLAPTDGKQNFLKLRITLRLNSEADVRFTQSKMPVIVDSLQIFLRGLRAIDLNGTGNALLVKEELIKRINKITSPVVVKEVLFKELLVN